MFPRILDFATVPGRHVWNAAYLQYRSPDGEVLGAAEQQVTGVWSKLATLTGMDAGDAHTFLLRSADGDEILQAEVHGAPFRGREGTRTVLEAPVGSPFGTIRYGRKTLAFDLADGRRIGGVFLPTTDTPNWRIVAAGGRPIGTAGSEFRREGLLDLLIDFDIGLTALGRVDQQNNPYRKLAVHLEDEVPQPLGTFVTALPIAIVMGYHQPGDIGEEEPDHALE